MADSGHPPAELHERLLICRTIKLNAGAHGGHRRCCHAQMQKNAQNKPQIARLILCVHTTLQVYCNLFLTFCEKSSSCRCGISWPLKIFLRREKLEHFLRFSSIILRTQVNFSLSFLEAPLKRADSPYQGEMPSKARQRGWGCSARRAVGVSFPEKWSFC